MPATSAMKSSPESASARVFGLRPSASTAAYVPTTPIVTEISHAGKYTPPTLVVGAHPAIVASSTHAAERAK
jgi:hypothetical protein